MSLMYFFKRACSLVAGTTTKATFTKAALLAVAGVAAVFWSAQLSYAAIYKTTDNTGAVLFTDKPEKIAGKAANDVEQLPERYISVIPATTLGISSSKPKVSGGMVGTPNYRVTLISPANDAVVHKGSGSLNLSASVTPSLQLGDRVELMIDGKKVADALTTTLDLSQINRGMHVATANVLDSGGRVVSTAKSGFYVYQRSLLTNPNGGDANKKAN